MPVELFHIIQAANRKRVDPAKAKITSAVLLLKSPGMARYMVRKVANVFPDLLITRILKPPDKVYECTIIAFEIFYSLHLF